MCPVLYIFRESIFRERILSRYPDLNLEELYERLEPNLQIADDPVMKMKYGLFLCELTNAGDTLEDIVYEAIVDKDLATSIIESIDEARIARVTF